MRDDDVSRLLGLEGFRALCIDEETEGSVTLFVEPEAALPQCPQCGQGVLTVHSTQERTVRHLDAFHRRSFLRFAQRMVACERCGVRAERISFVEPNKRSTSAFRRYVGELCKLLPNSQVAERMGLSEDSVRTMDKEFIEANYPPANLDQLRVLAIDEIACRKGQSYLTVIMDHKTGEVVWTGEGRGAKTPGLFFKILGPARCAQIVAVSMDMSAAYRKAVKAHCKNARVVFDHFHVSQHLNDAVNDTRKDVMRNATDKVRRAVKGQRFVLLRRRDNLDESGEARLDALLKLNEDLTRAYLLKEDFELFWACKSPAGASRFLDRWVREALSSGIPAITSVGKMIKRHRDGLLAYHTHPIGNGPLEGMNTKINVLRRAHYGFSDMEYFGLKIRQVSIDRSPRQRRRRIALEAGIQ